MEYLEIIEPKNKFSLGFKELAAYKELFYFFTWRDIKVRYKQATLGFLWAVIQPLSMMLLFTLVFSKGLKVQSDGVPYPIFAYSGLLVWNIFSSGLQNSANSMVNNAPIIKKIYFPRLIIPISSILVAVFDFIMSLMIFVVLIFIYGQQSHFLSMLFYLPLAIILTIVTTFGLGTFLASLNVKYRDFQYTVPFLIQFLLFINPVVYSTSIFKQVWVQRLIAINPMSSAIALSRKAFTNIPIQPDLLCISLISALFLLVLGIYTFRKTEAYFADLA